MASQGEGKAIILAVGGLTLAGKASKSLDIEKEHTPLQMKLDTVANFIGAIGMWTAVLTFVCMTARMCFQLY